MSEVEQEVQEEDVTGPTTVDPDEVPESPEAIPPDERPEDEPAEDEPLHEEDDAQEPQSAAPKSDKEMEAVFRKLDKLRKDVATRVSNILEDEAVNLMECPLCAAVAPGYLWSPDVASLHEDQVTAIRLLLNLPVATDYKQSEAFRVCDKCDGLGRVRTGSKVQNHEIAECPRCFAKGYIPAPVQLVPGENGHSHEQDASLTGPTVYGGTVTQADPSTAAIIESLKDRGYMIVEPLTPPRPATAQS